jgi:hypothetical protein
MPAGEYLYHGYVNITPHDADTGTVVYQIVLRDTEGYEPEPVSSRRFTLPLGSTFPIGRASRNTTKADLMPAEHNAFIDSPVISRDHAVLSATGDEDAPQIFVTDSKSMHGTFVNGERLEAHTPKQLKSGDILQFGVDVNRNEGTHLRQYSGFLLDLSSADFIFPQSTSLHAGTHSRQRSCRHRRLSRWATKCLTAMART